uniref:Polymerase (RNA) III (DNA directed) polypeptide G like b n=1 Tax=Cyprinus carpio TaxID=7962 RepID=A0A8C1JND9_CYPCA
LNREGFGRTIVRRGRGLRTFSVEIVGIGKGENLPPSPVTVPSDFCLMFQPLDQKPVPLQAGEEAEYMLALKQEFRGATKTLPFHIRPAAPKKGQSGTVCVSIQTLEQKEEEGSSDEEEGKKKKPEEEEAEGEEYDEEEFEDETDYIMSYFDNGEEFGGDSDDNIDEAIY